MHDRRSVDDLKRLGANLPAPENVVRLYRQAFVEFGSRALWSSRELPEPSLAAALAITESLRVEGNLAAREIAERIEGLCRAAL
jgi:hypothetical protein